MTIGNKKGMFPSIGSTPPAGDQGDDDKADAVKMPSIPEQQIGSLPPAGSTDESDRKDVQDVEVITTPSRPTGTIKKKFRRILLVPPASFPYSGTELRDANLWIIYDATSGENLGRFPEVGAARKHMDDEGFYD